MTGKRLFVVTIETEVIVVAENEREAERLARRVDREEEMDFVARPMVHMPTDWDTDCLPYGDHGGTSVGEWIERNAAPEYTKGLDALRKLRDRDGS